MKIYSNDGYIALASVLVIMAVVLIIGTSVSLLSINDIQSSLAHKKGEEVLALIEGCVEDAALRINENNSLPSTITIPEGTCTITTNSHVGNNWTYTVSGTIEQYSKQIQVSLTRTSTITITSWNEN